MYIFTKIESHLDRNVEANSTVSLYYTMKKMGNGEMRPSYNSSKDFELKLGINIERFYRYQYNIIPQWAKMLGENPLKNVDFSLSIRGNHVVDNNTKCCFNIGNFSAF